MSIPIPTFDRVMDAFADRFNRPFEPATAEMYRGILDSERITEAEFVAGARAVFRAAKFWPEPDAFVDAAKLVRLETAKAKREAQLEEERRLERELAARRPPIVPLTAAERAVITKPPRFDKDSTRTETCHCGREYVSEALAIDFLDSLSERMRNAWLHAFPQGRVPDECIPCSRRTNDREAYRTDYTLKVPAEPLRRSA